MGRHDQSLDKTVIAVLTGTGLGPALQLAGAMRTDRLEAYVWHVLALTFRRG